MREFRASLPTTPLQQGLLFHHVSSSAAGVDVQQIGIRLREPLDEERWQSAWQFAVQRFDVLRSCFSLTELGANRMVLNEFQLPMTETRWGGNLSERDLNLAISELSRQERLASPDPLSSVPQRMAVVHIAEDDYLVLWTFHHALLDGRSFVQVLRTVFNHYDGLHGSENPIVDFNSYVEQVNKPLSSAGRAFWEARVSSMEAVSGLRSAPVHAKGIGNDSDIFQVQQRALDLELSDSVRRLAIRAECSVHTILQAAWALLLCHHNRQEQVCFGSVRACRHSVPDGEEMVGLLINTVPLVVKVPNDASVMSVLKGIMAEQHALRSVETTPLSEILALAPFKGGPVFDTAIMFDTQSLDTRMRQLDQKRFANRRFSYEGQTNFPVTLIAYGDERILLRLEHYSSYLNEVAASNLVSELIRLLESLARVEDLSGTKAMTLPYLSRESLRQMAQWNATDTDYGAFLPLQQTLQKQSLKTPSATALQFEDQRLSYDAFDKAVNQLANFLQIKGLGTGDVVGVLVERSIDLLVSIHAVVRAGAAFLPLDAEFPDDRLDYMVSNAGAALVLHQSNLKDRCRKWPVEQLNLADAQLWANCSVLPPVVKSSPEDAAYILYTSGSTGRPKGVINTHQGIVNRLQWMQEALKLSADDVVLQKTPCSFDVSVWELFWPFMVGAKLVIAKPGGHRDPSYLCSLIQSEQVTVMHFVPSMLQLFLDEPAVVDCKSIRQIICSGEALPKLLQQRVFSSMNCRLHNLYGPTEAAIDVTWWECDPKSELPFVPLGKPVANTQLHVLDGSLEQVPVGVAGELCIGGVQVAQGYVNQPELTADRFIPDPFRVGGTLYRTGDLARWSADGMLEYLGRLDHQVKIRGQRVELGEIEQVLLSHDSVREVVVTATTGPDGQGRLTAYVVPATDTDRLALFAKERLPAFMVPSRWVGLERFALNASGKVDRAQLPDPVEQHDSRVGDDVAMSQSLDPTQSTVLKLWQDLLGDQSLSIDDHFLDSGGDSLSLLRLRNMLREHLGAELSVTELLANSSIRQQASLVQQLTKAASDLSNHVRSDSESTNGDSLCSTANGESSGTTALGERVRQRQQAIVNRRKKRLRGEHS